MTDMIFSTDGEEKFRIPSPFSHNYYVVTKCPTHKLEIKERKITSKETIQQLKEDIAIIQQKLEALEHLEKPKRDVEEAYKRVYGNYPDTGICNGMSYVWWDVFCKGYNASKEDYKVGAYQPKEKEQKWGDIVRESVKWCKEHPDESVEDYLTPQTPDKIEENLREAFKKVQQTEEWKETQRKIDSNYDEMVKNPPEFLKFELGKTLEALITRWWDDVLYGGIHQDWDREVAIDDLIDQIQLWLPREQSHEGTQSASVIDLVDGYNDALTKIKSKLRNKKDT